MKLETLKAIVDSDDLTGSFNMLTNTEQNVSAAARKELGGNLRKITTRPVVVAITWDEYRERLAQSAKAQGLADVPEAKKGWYTATEVPYLVKHNKTDALYLRTFPGEGKVETYYVLPNGSQASYEEIEQYLTASQRRDYKPASADGKARDAVMIRVYKLDSVLELTPLTDKR